MKMINKKYSTGFTLVEVLVAIIVLSIGLLGVMSMQVIGMKNNHSAYLRTQATLLAYDYSDILRTHINSVNNSTFFDATYNIPSSVSDAEANACTSSNCSADNMANADRARWSKSVIDSLPSGSGNVARNGDIFTVTITWEDDPNDLDNNNVTTSSFVTSFRP